MRFFDAHAHMSLLPEMDLGDIGVLNCGTNEDDNELVLKSKYFKAVGWWPNDKGSFEVVEKQAQNPGVVAIGEIGLDLHHFDSLKNQEGQFKKMLGLAKELDLPVSVHSRKAEERVLNVLEKYDLKVVLHSFMGKKKLVKEAIERGYFFSIPSSVVRSEQFIGMVGLIPVNQLLTETDSPFLGPVKNQTNTPLSIPLTVKKISEIKGLDCAARIFSNSKKVFMI